MYPVSQIAKAIKGKHHSFSNEDTYIRHLLIDSRKITSVENTLFFAIRGERHDGHRFIQELYDRGIRCFVVNQMPAHPERFNYAHFIETNNTQEALQELCAWHRIKFTIPVVGITGSNGKTIVKEWLYQLLHEDKNIVRSPKSYNSQVGVPLSVWQMTSSNDLAIFEAGISMPAEMKKLARIIQPTIGILTNIGQAHDENFENIKQKTDEKLKLFYHVETLIYCKDYTVVHQEIQENHQLKTVQQFTWSRRTRADLQIGRINKDGQETTIQAVFKNDFIQIRIPFTDEASVENAIHCWALLLCLGYNSELIARRMHYLSPVAMRLELKEGINNCSIINDSYNSDLGSLSIALDFLNQQKQHPRKTLVLSDILQSGKNEQQLYTEVAQLVKQKGIDRLIGIGKALQRQAMLFEGVDKSFFNDTKDFIHAYNNSFFFNETILLKGARSFSFEEISKFLQQKAHETVLEINLNALTHNLNYFRSRLKSDTKMMVMVKAFSYGSGSFEIANVLQFQRVDYLAVAYADEGIELRKAGITMPIMIMNPEVQSYDSMIQYRLEPEIFSFRVLQLFDEAAKRNRLSTDSTDALPVHLKLDTGMKRLGFEEKDINELIIRIKNNRNLKISSIFSHLAAGDSEEHDEFTRMQVKIFDKLSTAISDHFNYPILRHILNSSGISRLPDAQFDMVRLGIGMYGIGWNEEEQHHLQLVSTLKTTISQIKQVQQGESIGYSRKWLATRNMQIATIPIGYADGLSRKLSNGIGKMIVQGKIAPVVGNVCMDMCMIDITGIVAKEGEEVTVFGNQHSIIQMAKDLDTIPYEVLTNISRRVKRVYYQE